MTVAILDTFYTLFKTNSEEIRKGYNDAEKATGKFTDAMKRADDGVHVAGEKIVETFKEVGTAIVAAFAFEHIKQFIESTIEVNAHLEQTSLRIGVAVEDLAALQAAATRFGGSADGVTGSLDFLNRGLADIAVKGTSRLKPFFDELKIHVLDSKGHVKGLVEVIKEIAEATRGKTAQERAGLAERFQLDPGLLMAMADGRRGLEDIIKRQKELGLTTEEDAEAAEKFEQKMADLRVQFGHVGNQIVGGLLPIMGKVVDVVMGFVGFLEKHKGLVEGFFIGAAGVIATFYLPAIIEAAVATAAFLAEVLFIPALIAAVIAAFAFLYDDIQKFLSGNKSVIGELSKKWPIIGEVVREVAKDIGAAWDWVQSYFAGGVSFIKSIANVLAAVFGFLSGKVQAFGKAFNAEFPEVVTVLKAIGTLVEWVTSKVAALVGWWLKFAAKGVIALPKALTNVAGWLDSAAVSINGPKLAMGGTAPSLEARGAAKDRRIADMFQPHPAQTVAALRSGQKQIAAATATQLSSVTHNAISNSNRTTTKKIEVKTGDITIHTQAKSGDEVTAALGDHLAEHVRKAIAQHDDGVAM